jgi:hypothetical protein
VICFRGENRIPPESCPYVGHSVESAYRIGATGAVAFCAWEETTDTTLAAAIRYRQFLAWFIGPLTIRGCARVRGSSGLLDYTEPILAGRRCYGIDT